MAFEMPTSRTADAARLAVLWRDKDKRGAGGSGVPDHFAEDIFEGGILPEVILPPAGPPTTNPDGSVTPAVPPTPTLADHKTVYTDSQGLKSLYEAVLDIRAWLAPVVNPSTSLQFVPNMGILIGGTVYTALEAIEAAVEDFERRLGVVEGGLAQAISDAADALRVADSTMSSLEIFKGQINPKVETLRRDMIYAEERIRSLEERHNQLAQRVGVLESGTYTQ